MKVLLQQHLREGRFTLSASSYLCAVSMRLFTCWNALFYAKECGAWPKRKGRAKEPASCVSTTSATAATLDFKFQGPCCVSTTSTTAATLDFKFQGPCCFSLLSREQMTAQSRCDTLEGRARLFHYKDNWRTSVKVTVPLMRATSWRRPAKD